MSPKAFSVKQEKQIVKDYSSGLSVTQLAGKYRVSHAAFECMDCGSINIRAVSLEGS